MTRKGIRPDIPSTGDKDCPVSAGSGEEELHPDFNREDRALSRGEYPRRWQEGWSASQRPGLLWSLLAGHQGSQASGDLAHRQRDRGRPARCSRSGEQFSGKTALRKTALQEIHVHHCKPFLVSAPRKCSQGPRACVPCSTANAPGTLGSQAGILPGGWGHPRDTFVCSRGPDRRGSCLSAELWAESFRTKSSTAL